MAPCVPVAILDPCFLGGIERVKEGESYSPSMRFDIHPYCRLSLAFCWCPFELLGGGLFGAKKSFPRETNAVTWMGLEARVQATSTRSPANQPMRPLHYQHENFKKLKLQVYFKLIAYKRKTKSML